MASTYAVDGSGSKHVASAAALAREVLGAHAADVDAAGRFPVEAVEALSRSGLSGLFAPGQLGGGGQGPRVFAAVVEELARACASTALVYVNHVAGAQAIAASIALDSRDAILREIAAGKHLTTLALAEGDAGRPLWAPSSALEPRDGGYVASARKAGVVAARRADSFVAGARCPGASSPVDGALFLMRPRAADVHAKAAGAGGLGLRGAETAPVDVDGYRLGAADLLTALGDGLKMTLEVVLPWQCLGLAALANGVALAALEAMAAYLGVGAAGEPDGGALRDRAAPRARLAEMSVRTEQARALLGQAVGALESAATAAPIALMQSRLAASRAALEVTEIAVTLGGGATQSRQLSFERWFRDARAVSVVPPSADQLLDCIGRGLSGLPLVDPQDLDRL